MGGSRYPRLAWLRLVLLRVYQSMVLRLWKYAVLLRGVDIGTLRQIVDIAVDGAAGSLLDGAVGELAVLP